VLAALAMADASRRKLRATQQPKAIGSASLRLVTFGSFFAKVISLKPADYEPLSSQHAHPRYYQLGIREGR
jgi:hypothetical protein